ncbi:hypothetical protein [Archangium sp.]|jgi:hypothetical protein|uniref:hypothetical protein n=1 Tax=Archangium sp. TaxID=1872627 RepID=UPI002ED9DE83
MAARVNVLEKPRRGLLIRVALLTCIGASGCQDIEGVQCTSADTTHSCCVKKNPTRLGVCDGIEGTEEGATFRSNTAPDGKTVTVAVGAATLSGAATVLVTMTDAAQFRKLLAQLDKVMEECVELAEQTVDRRRPTWEILDASRCKQEVGTDARGKPVTRAMQLGNEKHEEAFQCVEEKLGELIPGHYSLEQRYRYDRKTGKLELVSQGEEQQLMRQGRQRELLGTIQPDVVIHSGDPLQVRAVYDFKFPCIPGSPPTWTVYKRPPYQDLSQGAVYQDAFKAPTARVAPGKGVIRR